MYNKGGQSALVLVQSTEVMSVMRAGVLWITKCQNLEMYSRTCFMQCRDMYTLV